MKSVRHYSAVSAIVLTVSALVVAPGPASALSLAQPDSIAVGVNPFDLALTPNGKKLYVTNSGSGSVSVIKTSTNLAQTISSFDVPVTIDISPNGKSAFVFDSGNNDISIINTKSDRVSKNFELGTDVSVCRINPKATLFGCATSSAP